MRKDDIEIKEGDSARFRIGKREYIEVRVVDGEARIYTDGILHVIPWATNSIRLRIEK